MKLEVQELTFESPRNDNKQNNKYIQQSENIIDDCWFFQSESHRHCEHKNKSNVNQLNQFLKKSMKHCN